MAGPVNIADTIFENPLFRDFPTGIPAGGAQGGRLMSSMPHVDGVLFGDAFDIKAFPVANSALVRIAVGDWVARATVAANTNNYALNVSALGYRTGETYFLAAPGASPTHNLQPPPKGVAVTSIFAEYNVGVAALASGSIGLTKTVYVNGVARVVTAIVAPVALTAGQLAVSTNGSTLVVIPVPGNPDTQAFITDPNVLWQAELITTQAATTTLDIIGIGVGYNFNWN